MKNIPVTIALLAAISTPATAQTVSPTGPSNVPPAPMQNQSGVLGNVQAPTNPYAPVAGQTPYTTEQCAHQSLSGATTGTVGSAGTGAANSPNCN